MKLCAFRSLLLLRSLVPSSLAAQPSAPKPIAAPLRDLKFGTINFLHTTDTHGWHAGHLLEASFSADWGDYYDFSSRLREQIEADGNDLLIVDSGDRIEGNGLCDASTPVGLYTYDIFKQQHMDLVCSGNHELYKNTSSENDHKILVPAYHDAYLASNIDIIDPDTLKVVPLAQRFKKFTTKKQGIRILAFGFLFNFDRNSPNTIVQPVEQTVQESWFQEALYDNDLDLILVVAHIPARSTEFDVLHKAFRAAHPDIPIQFLGGHYHIRDYKKYDDKAYALASGRFMETIGFQSIDGIVGRGKKHTNSVAATSPTPTWFRRYIDNNLYSFYHHTNTTASSFHTIYGSLISDRIDGARRALHLDHRYGCAPRTLWMSRAPFPASNSVYSWLNDTVLPTLPTEPGRENRSRVVLTNTGAIRFDIFQGPFTRDSEYIISPFSSGLAYFRDVPTKIALQVADLLNSGGQVLTTSSNEKLEPWRLAPPEQYGRPYSSPITLLKPHDQVVMAPTQHFLIPGYTTVDDAGPDGDDTLHTPISFYRVPNVIRSYTPADGSLATADLVFNDFLVPYILAALAALGDVRAPTDVAAYLPGHSMTELITDWVEENWSC